MGSSKEYLQFILEQLAGLDGISYSPMMGEYIIYYRDKIVGGIYDDRFLVKPVPSAIRRFLAATYELPYEGGKEMLLVEEVDDKEFLKSLIVEMYEELPVPKTKGNDNFQSVKTKVSQQKKYISLTFYARGYFFIFVSWHLISSLSHNKCKTFLELSNILSKIK